MTRTQLNIYYVYVIVVVNSNLNYPFCCLPIQSVQQLLNVNH